MKRRSIIAVLISLTLIMAMALSACGSKEPDTLEKYIQNDEQASAEIQQTADTNGLEVSIKGNDVVYTYDLKNFEGVTEDLAKSDTMKESLASALNDAGSTFSDLCKQLEEGSKIEGIQIIVNYTYDGETLVTKTFNKDGAVE